LAFGAKLAMTMPTPTRTPPIEAATRGPILSCRRPANTIVRPNIPSAMAYGVSASAAENASLFVSALVNMLHVYRTPRHRLIPTPASTTTLPQDA
jgi:hypothetical protein